MVRPATSGLSQWIKAWIQSKQQDPMDAPIATLAAPMTPSLKRFSTKPPVMMPKATAGRFRMPRQKDECKNVKKIYFHTISKAMYQRGQTQE